MDVRYIDMEVDKSYMCNDVEYKKSDNGMLWFKNISGYWYESVYTLKQTINEMKFEEIDKTEEYFKKFDIELGECYYVLNKLEMCGYSSYRHCKGNMADLIEKRTIYMYKHLEDILVVIEEMGWKK